MLRNLIMILLIPVAMEVVDDIFDACEVDSDGGKVITKQEWEKIIAEAGKSIAEKLAEVLGGLLAAGQLGSLKFASSKHVKALRAARLSLDNKG